MSPTEFSNYIKQRALQQQIGGAGSHHLSGLRSPSLIQPDHTGYFYPATPFQSYNNTPQYPASHNGVRYSDPASNGQPFYVPHTPHGNTTHTPGSPADAKLIDLLPSSYPAGQYQHLLVAN